MNTRTQISINRTAIGSLLFSDSITEIDHSVSDCTLHFTQIQFTQWCQYNLKVKSISAENLPYYFN